MSKALTIGVAILSLITGMAGGLGTGYLIYRPQVSNLQSSQDFDSLIINARYIIGNGKILNITFSNPTEAPIYFQLKFLVYYVNQTMGWRHIEIPYKPLIYPNNRTSVLKWGVPSYFETAIETGKMYLVGDNFHREITVTIEYEEVALVKFLSVTFNENDSITITIKNVGYVAFTIDIFNITENGVFFFYDIEDIHLDMNETTSINLQPVIWKISGTSYTIILITTDNEEFHKTVVAP